MKTETVHGIKYSKPEVTILQSTGLGVPEIAARTCYDSFNASENRIIQFYDTHDAESLLENPQILDEVNDIDSSALLTSLAWVHHHHSILEHTNISFHITGTSRGVLQELARHRMQAISVRSTRYTMSSVINAFVACRNRLDSNSRFRFASIIRNMGILVTTDSAYNDIEIGVMWHKLNYQYSELGTIKFHGIAVAKSSMELLTALPNADPTVDTDNLFKALQDGKKKRNVGDAFKHIVTDNWKVDLVSTMNLRALKNFLELRDSGAAYFQIRWLAQEMKAVMPSKYLDLIVKEK